MFFPHNTSTQNLGERFDEAVVEGKTAHKLEPFSLTIYSDYIRDLYYAGRLDEAGTESLKLVETDPRFARAYYELHLVLEDEGKLDEAIALKYLPDNVAALTALGHAQARAGKRAEAEKVIERLQEIWLEKARDERFNWMPFIKVDPVSKNLRSEPRFIELAKGLGL